MRHRTSCIPRGQGYKLVFHHPSVQVSIERCERGVTVSLLVRRTYDTTKNCHCILSLFACAMPDFNLEHFIKAQDPVIDQVRTELRRGRKTSHWMWFVFPQLAGLGSSSMSRLYAIHSLDEARAYLAHPILGARLTELTQIVIDLSATTVEEIFGHPDNLKFRSCMTLFAEVAPPGSVFHLALDKYFGA